MPTTDIEQRVKRISGLSDQEIEGLTTIGIATEDDLRYAEFVDLPVIIPVIKRRKLNIISQYLAKGEALNATITIDQIQLLMNTPEAPVGAAPAYQGGNPDPGRGAPKVYTDPLPDFSGEAVDYEEWERKAGATIKQTAYKDLLDNAATIGDLVQEARSKELYNMILSCVADGHALNTIEKVRDNNNGLECGYLAWKSLKDWYLDPTQRDNMIHHWERKLADIALDRDTSATEYINNFEMYVRKLSKLGENWSDDKKIREFKAGVSDEDYDTEVRVHKGTFTKLIETVRVREQDLGRNADNRSRNNKRNRRVMSHDVDTDDESQDKSTRKRNKTGNDSNGKPTPFIPFIPKFLYHSFDSEGKKNLVTWRTMVNKGEIMGKEDLISSDKVVDDKDSDKPSKKPGKGKGTKKTRRVTKTRRIGIQDDTVEIKLASSDSEYMNLANVESRKRVVTFGDDSVIPLKPDHSIKDIEGTSRIRILKRAMSVGMSKGSTRHPPYAVIDPGAEKEVIGGVGWHILHFSDKSESLSGALAGMGNKVLPSVDAVTAVEDTEGRVVLLGIGEAAYDRRITQHEALWNSHHLRANRVEVHDVAKNEGGDQCIKVRDHNGERIIIPLKFNGDIMTVDIREPSEEELLALRVIWLTPPMETITPQSIRRSRGALKDFNIQRPGEESVVPEEEISVHQSEPVPDIGKGKRTVGEWKELLAFPSDEVIEKTLESTSQLQVEPVESERREIPKQHRKKRLLMLHPRRLKGRTDTDTFFSTVKSIRGYLCVQMFCHVLSDYIFVRCMQRESHSHGAYQDYIREVGASEKIVTDNSKTQTGKKWEKTSRDVMTKQRKFTPHNQNESKVERRIQDVKHKTVLVLQRCGAPLIFWCYALIFVVDCLNHIAKKPLGWRTSYEVLNGDTADISPFRFKFWQPIKFMDKSQFPGSTWVLGRFIGIAWDTGDLFTFKVWSEPEGKWQDGQEFVRNVVRPRAESEMPTSQEENPDLNQFRFQRKYRTKKRKRNKEFIYELRDIPEGNEEIDDTTEIGNGDEEFELVDPSTERNLVVQSGTESTDSGGEGDGTVRSTTTTTTTPKPTPHQNFSQQPDQEHIDLEEPTESVKEINDHLSRPDEAEGIGGSIVKEIVGHDWRIGALHLQVKWSDNSTQWIHLRDMREDYPRMTAQYIVVNKVSRSKRGGDRVLLWAKKVVRDLDRAVRRITHLYDLHLDEHDEVRMVRRVQKNSKKRKKFSTAPVFKYGIEVPKTTEHAKRIDEANGNTFWQDAFEKEVKALLGLDCFEFHPEGYHKTLGEGWQRTSLHMVFDVKQDLTRKCRLVAGGHLVDMLDIQVYSSTVKSISVQLLHVISHKANLEQLCGDIGNAFPNAYTNEKVYIPKAGIEFGELAGKCIIIKKALYGLCSSAERFHAHLADTLRSFGFKQTRFDNDVWIRLDDSGKRYEYICTHVDDFMICSRNPKRVMDEICSVYLVKDKSKGPPSYYLGNDYKKDKKGRWCIGCKTYLTEAIRRLEELFGKPLSKKDTPMVDSDHPEEDASEPLNDEGHRHYQMLIGMLNWIVCIGRMDVAFATASLSRFSACPRKGHMDRAMRVFGYLKKYRNRRIVIDSRDPIRVGGKDALDLDFPEMFKEAYPDAAEEIDSKVPEALIDELEITAFVDSDHAHDKLTRRSITGLLIIVGRTPVYFMSRRQGAISTSTYGAEFCAMRTAVEEVQAVRYMLRCLGVKVKHATLICGDNKGVIQNCTMSDSLLKKKHVAIAYHKTREAAAAGIVHPIKIRSEHNFADILTKAVTGRTFWALYGKLTSGSKEQD
jgi:hypothetical protein